MTMKSMITMYKSMKNEQSKNEQAHNLKKILFCVFSFVFNKKKNYGA